MHCSVHTSPPLPSLPPFLPALLPPSLPPPSLAHSLLPSDGSSTETHADSLYNILKNSSGVKHTGGDVHSSLSNLDCEYAVVEFRPGSQEASCALPAQEYIIPPYIIHLDEPCVSLQCVGVPLLLLWYPSSATVQCPPGSEDSDRGRNVCNTIPHSIFEPSLRTPPHPHEEPSSDFYLTWLVSTTALRKNDVFHSIRQCVHSSLAVYCTVRTLNERNSSCLILKSKALCFLCEDEGEGDLGTL